MSEAVVAKPLDPADTDAVHRLIARVLHVPELQVVAAADLIHDLGAESIDFLDLIFGLDPIVEGHVKPEQWGEWLKQRFPDGAQGASLTVGVFEEFAASCRAGFARGPELA